jgi:two-component system phosphate regulon response regulator PhoB
VKILVVDDEAEVVDVVAVAARFQWPDVTTISAYGGEHGLELFYKEAPDVVVLDVAMPGTTGFEVLRRIRQTSDVPVILLTGRTAEADQVRGLELGADEYVTKPFGPMVLLARIRALVRRARAIPPARASNDLKVGALTMDFTAREVRLSGQPVSLGPAEYRLLYHLASHAGRFLDHRELSHLVWGSDWSATGNNVKSLVNRLRAKIDLGSGAANLIENRRGVGYRFVDPENTAPEPAGPVGPASVGPR